MSKEGKGQRKRAPPGYYSYLSGQKGQVMAADMTGELQNLKKSRKTKSKAGSKPGSSKAESMSGNKPETELEKRLREIDLQGESVGKELDELEGRDAYSATLHKRALNREIDFVEDIEPPKDLEKDEVWEKVNEDHRKEDEILHDRHKRLQRREELMAIQQQLRENRLKLVKQEKQLEMEEKRRQMEVQAEWLRVQKEEFQLQQEWQSQQLEYEEFLKMKSVDGWVASTVPRCEGAEVGKAKKNPGQTKATLPDSGRQAVRSEAEKLRTLYEKQDMPDTGIRHLNRMGLLPQYGMMQDEQDVSLKQLPAQKQMTKAPAEMWDHLSLRPDGGKENLGVGAVDEPVGEKPEKQKIKSGKFAKSHAELVREESWPHLNVLRQYSKRTPFDQMEFDAFVAGETRVIGAMWQKSPDRAKGRLKVLCRVAHWVCKCKDWPAVRNIYEAIIESVELGESEWWSSFDSLESLLPPSASVMDKLKKEEKDKERNKESRKGPESFWCKDFQKGLCTETSPHQVQLKPDEKPVTVLHMCATCYQKDKKKRDHPDGDSACPHKKA